MEITLNELINSDQALGILGEAKELPASIKYRVGKAIDKLVAEFRPFNEQRKELLEKYGQPVKDQPDQFTFPDEEKQKAYLKELEELLNEKIELKITPISVDVFDRVPELTAHHMRSLFWLVEEKVE